MSTRWQQAQLAEVQYWQHKRDVILSDDYREEIRVRANRVEDRLNSCSHPAEGRTILEIGGGATPLIDFFSHFTAKHAVDPLADYYCAAFSRVLSSDVKWMAGPAESLPFPDATFDVVVNRNVLDHVDSPALVLSEMHRILSPDGIVYLALNTLSGPLYAVRSILKQPEHPHVFSHQDLLNLVLLSGFQVMECVRDAPETMGAFRQETYACPLRRLAHYFLLTLDCYHFTEFILKKA